jgi:hypothetical protein
MIISHEHKFIFIKTKKTAGTSIEIALSKICGKNDILTGINEEDEQLRWKHYKRRAQNFDIPFKYYSIKDWLRLLLKRNKKKYYNHMPASLVKKNVSKEIWDSYYKFCFERHPLDKVYSHYWWRGGDEKYGNLEAYFSEEDYKVIQGSMLYRNTKGEILIDDIYQLENINEAITIISKKLSLNEKDQLSLLNNQSKSNKKKQLTPKDEFFTTSRIKQVKKLFKDEFELYEDDEGS